jgi:pimeloyl-ACP methyl ester carboxylesterase
MPYTENGDVRLYYEESGSGFPVVFVHEFADDCQGWAPQVGYFSRRYRCITFNARGYPPSDVPEDQSLYSQSLAADDIAAVMRGVGIERAHIVGISMGGFATLHFGLRYASMAESLTVAACGYGAAPEQREQFARESEAIASQYEQFGAAHVAETYALGAYRVQFRDKDLLAWRAFRDRLAAHSSKGAALTMRGVQKQRPSLYDLEEELSEMKVPTLIINGDEDDWCLEPGIYLKRTIPAAGLWIVPKTGHTVNLEEPGLFNDALAQFFAMAEAGKWSERQAAVGASALLSS